MERPFYSIIIPYYNGSKTIDRLMLSILFQHMNNDIEVIICDDCSPEDPEILNSIINKYSNLLTIKQTKTDINGGPGAAREKGTQLATGQWICFCDNDDELVPGTFSKVKDEIIKCKEPYYVMCNFYLTDPKTGKVITEIKERLNWCHGKFYNLDNLWKAYNVHFHPRLRSREDIYISATMNCIMNHLNRKPYHSETFVYNWNNNLDSLSHTTKTTEDGIKHSFLESLFQDYLDATLYVYLDKYEQGFIDKNYCLRNCDEVFSYCYFSISAFEFTHEGAQLQENYEKVYKALQDAKRIVGYTIEHTYKWMSLKNCIMYRKAMEAAAIASGYCIPRKGFLEWYQEIEDKYGVER